MLIINPGSGPVKDATLEQADANIGAFIADLDMGPLRIYRLPSLDRDGRFGFRLDREDELTGLSVALVEITMPGLPLEEVRWQDGLDPWQFPRLYVDGSSWLWAYALNAARHELTNDNDEA